MKTAPADRPVDRPVPVLAASPAVFRHCDAGWNIGGSTQRSPIDGTFERRPCTEDCRGATAHQVRTPCPNCEAAASLCRAHGGPTTRNAADRVRSWAGAWTPRHPGCWWWEVRHATFELGPSHVARNARARRPGRRRVCPPRVLTQVPVRSPKRPVWAGPPGGESGDATVGTWRCSDRRRSVSSHLLRGGTQTSPPGARVVRADAVCFRGPVWTVLPPPQRYASPLRRETPGWIAWPRMTPSDDGEPRSAG